MLTSEWMDHLIDSVDKFFNLETTDGVVREGRISGFSFREFTYNEEVVSIPTEIEVNGDANDRIPVNRIAVIKVY